MHKSKEAAFTRLWGQLLLYGFKSSLFGKSAGYEAVQKKFVRSKSEIKDRKLAYMTTT